jgi:hypothetical protein
MEKDPAKVSLWKLSGRVLVLAIVVSLIGVVINFAALHLAQLIEDSGERNPAAPRVNVA